MMLNCTGVTYPSGLEDLAQAGEVIDARVESIDGIVEYLQGGLQRGYRGG